MADATTKRGTANEAVGSYNSSARRAALGLWWEPHGRDSRGSLQSGLLDLGRRRFELVSAALNA